MPICKTTVRKWWWVAPFTAALIAFMIWASLGIVSNNNFQQKQLKQFCTYVVIPLKGILESVQTSADRNPLPPGISDEQRRYYEIQRAQNREAFEGWHKLLDKVDCRAFG